MPRFKVVNPKGVGFRNSTELDDKASVKPAKFGEILEGTLVQGVQGLEWLELATGEGLFLPVRAPDGTQLCQPLPDEASKGKFIPWQDVDVGGNTIVARSDGGASGGAGRSNELAALDAKYDKKGSRPARNGSRPGSRGVAATAVAQLGRLVDSHDRTTAYMHDFRDALEDMGIDTRDDQYLNRYAPIGGAVDAVRPGSGHSAMRPSSGASAGPTRTMRSGASAPPARPPGSSQSNTRAPTPGSDGSPASGVRSALADRKPTSGSGTLSQCGAMLLSRPSVASAAGRWGEGPKNATGPVKEWTSVKHGKEVQNRSSSGRVIDVSDRNVLCMSMLGEKAVLGSADHGLKEIDVQRGQSLRKLHTERFGHSEWVTTVSHCPDGRVLSGAQDSKLCLWNSSGPACVDLTGHLGPVSRVRVDGAGKLAVSASYDRTLGVWDLRSKRQAASCTGHNAPVMDFVWWDHVIASGDRSGVVKLWDTNHVQNIATLKGHKGHITAMLAVPPDGETPTPTILTGAQDGSIRVWDLRQKLNVCTMNAHEGGAVNDLGVSVVRGAPLLVSTGADGRVLVLEPRSNYTPLYEFAEVTQDFLYSLLLVDTVAFTGDGQGFVTCFGLDDGQKRYTLNAGTNAIRCMGVTSSSLVCAGDDGNAVIFDF